MVRAFIIDDSALFRRLIKRMLEEDGTIEVVGSAANPILARDKIKALDPDVLTLDVEMDRMDGITFLRNLMRLRPMPVVMVSAFTSRGADVTLEALSIGAVDIVTKPTLDLERSFAPQAAELREKVRSAAGSNRRLPIRTASRTAGASEVTVPPIGAGTEGMVLAFGASTGGTQALATILEALPPDSPGVVISQHIPAMFSAPFARRLCRNSSLAVSEARSGQAIEPGHAYVAPGGVNLRVERTRSGFRCALDASPAGEVLRPCIDVLFHSVSQAAGDGAIGVLLTGMGGDGAEGLLAMRRRGAYTIAQDEATSVVWGMPGAAVKRDAACAVLPVDRIAAELATRVKRRATGGRRPRASASSANSLASADTGSRKGFHTAEEAG